MSVPRIYHDLAYLWPVVSPPVDYAAEAQWIRGAIGEGRGRSILELGAGGGHSLCHLVDDYDVVALDTSETMLAFCRELNPSVQTHVGDLRTVRLDRRFDVVLAHDVLDYMVSENDLRAAVATAAVHLDRGGLFIAAASYLADDFADCDVVHDFHQVDGVEAVSLSYVHRPRKQPHPSGRGIELIVLLIVREAGKVRIEEDRHHCGLFSRAVWVNILEEACFEVDSEINSAAGARFVCVKR